MLIGVFECNLFVMLVFWPARFAPIVWIYNLAKRIMAFFFVITCVIYIYIVANDMMRKEFESLFHITINLSTTITLRFIIVSWTLLKKKSNKTFPIHKSTVLALAVSTYLPVIYL